MHKISRKQLEINDTQSTAQFLLGKKLCFKPRSGSEIISGMIIETEAYEEDDPSAHSFSGKTERNKSMFADPGTVYVYLIYGIHLCLNIVTSAKGIGNAVLIRSFKPLSGINIMRENRGKENISDLCSGPAKLTEAFGITRDYDGFNVFNNQSPIWLENYKEINSSEIKKTPRIGISKSKSKLLRFVVEAD
jgi:DNA-3-methyladenine glycosylase